MKNQKVTKNVPENAVKAVADVTVGEDATAADAVAMAEETDAIRSSSLQRAYTLEKRRPIGLRFSNIELTHY